MRLFDAYLAIDWSARSSRSPAAPTADAIWVCERLIQEDPGITSSSERYFRTRMDCRAHLHARLAEHVRHGRRVFVGFDFAYGYPAGFANACGFVGSGSPWHLVWDELGRRIEDRPDNSNNRFQVAGELNRLCQGETLGPFWGCPVGSEISGLGPKSPAYPYRTGSGFVLERLRETERRLGGVNPTWKLYGAGSVGGQTLVGIPVVASLRDDPELRAVSLVWPFETGFDLASPSPWTPFILHVEIWPGVVRHRLDRTIAIKDKAEVRAMVEWRSERDMGDALSPLFERPNGLLEVQLRKVTEQEGCILGSGLPKGAAA